MISIEDLKKKPKIGRGDIAELLESIGKPGEKREEKIAAIKELGRNNNQGYGIHETLESYNEF